ncbi:HNH endonuclease signature motif containing protein, partial [Streptomyces sp. NPDC015032]|uniref:HNH endonuclease signature motif containing protein n=1 Tax=Streptomyces sp. NPDC015032 TaxID=3364937 RepID=UPI0036F647D9
RRVLRCPQRELPSYGSSRSNDQGVHDQGETPNGRCEHKPPLWFRCPAPGTEADHIHPWSRGGPTELWNGQLLFRRHNRRKSNRVPSPLYRWRLARWRKKY